MQTLNQRRRVWIVGIAGALILASTLVMILRQPKPITAEAERLNIAYAVGNPDPLFDAGIPEEIERNHLTKTKFREFFSTLVWPRLQRFGNKRAPLTEALLGGSEGASFISAADGGNNSHEFSLCVWASDDGPRVELVTSTLFAAWIAEFVESKGAPLTGESMLRAKLAGYAVDRAKLDQMGIEGALTVGPGGTRFKTWDELVADWQRQVPR